MSAVLEVDTKSAPAREIQLTHTFHLMPAGILVWSVFGLLSRHFRSETVSLHSCDFLTSSMNLPENMILNFAFDIGSGLSEPQLKEPLVESIGTVYLRVGFRCSMWS